MNDKPRLTGILWNVKLLDMLGQVLMIRNNSNTMAELIQLLYKYV
jgi:hypothetical protein